MRSSMWLERRSLMKNHNSKMCKKSGSVSVDGLLIKLESVHDVKIV